MGEVHIRPMRKEDVPQVDAIAREAFPEEPSPPSFKRSLRYPARQWFLVACGGQADDGSSYSTGAERPASGGVPWPLSWIRDLFINDHPPEGKLSPAKEHVIGYVGIEKDGDRCHIVDIAVRRSYRRQRIGELLLRSMIEQALQLQANYLTLEVRVSNRLAQTLYVKYGFSIVERRSNYYVDKHGQQEDGYYMATRRITSPSYQALLDQLKPATPDADARVATR